MITFLSVAIAYRIPRKIKNIAAKSPTEARDMSEDVLHDRLQRLVDDFKVNLRRILEELNSSARRATLVHRARTSGNHTTVAVETKRKNLLSKDVNSKLHELSGVVGVLSTCLRSHTPRTFKYESMEGPNVMICGPPGTEPGPELSVAQMDRNESLVYSRSSTSLASKPSPLQNMMIPEKDTAKQVYRVFACAPEDNVGRCTRARTNTFMAPALRKVGPYLRRESDSSVSDSEFSDSDEEEEYMIGPTTERFRGLHRNKKNIPPKPAPLKLYQKSNNSSDTTDSDETTLEATATGKRIGESILKGVNRRTSSAESDNYETAREDLSAVTDDMNVESGNIFSFDVDASCISQSKVSPHEPNSSIETHGASGETTATVVKKADTTCKSTLFGSLDDKSISNSGIYSFMKRLEENSFDEKSRKKGDLFSSESKTGSAVAVRRKNGSITATLQRQPVVRLDRVRLPERVLERLQQKMESKYFPNAELSAQQELSLRLKTDTTDARVETVVEDDSVPTDMHVDVGCYDSELVSDVVKQEDKEQNTNSEISFTPKSTRMLSKHSFSLSLKRPAPKTNFSTLSVHNVGKKADNILSLSSAKRRLVYSDRSRMWSSDSDFDSTPSSQAVTNHLSKDIKMLNSVTVTPTLKKKKVLSSYSSAEEEVVPSFLQKKKVAANVKLEEPRDVGDFDVGEFDMGENPESVDEEEKVQSSNSDYTKLGKYEKSSRSKGKEKATTKFSTLSSKVICAACGKNIYWKTKKVHSHPRLSLLVCQKCYDKFNDGSFDVDGTNEIYCTLCGDGGEIVLCSFCSHSFCKECIKRHSGEEHLNYLLSSADVEFKCYTCNPKDIKDLQDICEEVCYQLRESAKSYNQQKTYKSAKYVVESDKESASDGHENSDIDKDIEGGDTTAGPSGRWSLEGGIGESSKRRGRSAQWKNLEEVTVDINNSDGANKSLSTSQGEETGKLKKSFSSHQEKESGESNKSRSTPSKGSPRKKNVRSKMADLGGYDSSSSDLMSGTDQSSEVNTDDVSMSDSSLFEGGFRSKRHKNTKAREHRKTREPKEGGGNSDKSNVEEKDHDKQTETKKLKKKKKKIKVSGLMDSILSNSDFDGSNSGEAGDPPKPPKRILKKRKHNSSSDDQSKPLRKRGHLRSTLSSGSGSSDEERLAINVSDVEVNGNDHSDSSHGLFDNRMSDDEGSQSLKYLTPVKLKKSRAPDDSSDSDLVPLKRTGKKDSARKALESNSSLEKDETAETSKTDEKRKMYKTRSKKRKRHEDGDGNGGSSDDFVSNDLSLRGPRLNKKRKRLQLKSFLSSESSSTEEEEEEGGKEKEGEGEGKRKKEGEEKTEKSKTPDTPGLKRKNIRKLIADEKLAKSTRTAQKEEEERLERLKEKARLLAPIEDSERVVLEQDPTTKKVKVEVRDSLVRSLKPHQKQGIKFLYDSCIENMDRFQGGKGQTNGAILAHCMGLGKTLQVISFVDALLNCEESGVKRVLVLSPVNAIHNWIKEFRYWIPLMECDYSVHILNEQGTLSRLKRLRSWYNSSGIILIGYEMYRNLVSGKNIRRKTYREELAQYLLDPGPDVIICDEGHIMRNSKSSLSIVLGRIRTRTRIVLTGTPLQNNLLEYYTMVNFVKPNLLGTQREFTNRFVNPIKNGQCRDSNPLDIRKMKQRAHVLHMLLQGSVQRRDYRVLAEVLPPKQEYVLNIRMSPIQDQLYRRFLEQTRGIFLPSDLFSTYHTLSKVWNHPWVLKLDEDRQLEREERKAMYGLSDTSEEEDDDDTLGGFIVDSDDSTSTSTSGSVTATRMTRSSRMRQSVSSRSSSAVNSRSATPSAVQVPPCIVISSDDGSDSETKKKKGETNSAGSAEVSCGNDTTSSVDALRKPPEEKAPPAWYKDLLSEESVNNIGLSGKLLFLSELLKETEKLKEKVLVFSQSLLTLDLIEEFLCKEENGDWTPGLDYYRLDGSTNAQIRMANMNEFNKLSNSRLRLFLISTRAGSLGVNLVGANRVIIFDACWNPSHDLQAIFRTYRYGQTKPIFVYRLLAQGTMEEKIYDRQVTKQSLSMRVVDEKQIGRHFTASDLAELFTYSPAPPPGATESEKAIKIPQEDMVLTSILEHMHPQWIVSYHEHDSLLEHVFDEELSEEERKAAWESYNAQKSAETRRYNIEALHAKLQREEEKLRSMVENSSATAAMPQSSEPNPAVMAQNLRPVSAMAQMSQPTNSTSSQTAKFNATLAEKFRAAAADLNKRLAAQRQAISNLPYSTYHMDNELTSLTQTVVQNIDLTLQKIATLQRLHQEKERLVAYYGRGAVTLSVSNEMRSADYKIQEGYIALSKLIQTANDSIVRFNHSPAAQVGHLLKIVTVKREELNTRLDFLKNHKFMSGARQTSSGSNVQSSLRTPAQHVPSSGGQAVRSHQTVHRSDNSTASNSSQGFRGVVGERAAFSHPHAVVGHTPPTRRDVVPHSNEVIRSLLVTQGTSAGQDGSVRERIRNRAVEGNQQMQMKERAKELLVEKTRVPADSTSSNIGSSGNMPRTSKL